MNDMLQMLASSGLSHALSVTRLIHEAHCVVAKARWNDGRRVNLEQVRPCGFITHKLTASFIRSGPGPPSSLTDKALVRSRSTDPRPKNAAFPS